MEHAELIALRPDCFRWLLERLDAEDSDEMMAEVMEALAPAGPVLTKKGASDPDVLIKALGDVHSVLHAWQLSLIVSECDDWDAIVDEGIARRAAFPSEEIAFTDESGHKQYVSA